METDRTPKLLPTAPMVPIALAMMLGIVADRFGGWFSTVAWGGIGLASAILALMAMRGSTIVGNTAIFVAFAAIGGGWHHYWWMDLARDDLARSRWAEPEPVWVRGVVVTDPEFRPGESAGDRGSSRLIFAVTAISDGRDWRPASGRLLTFVSGGSVELRAGDAAEAAGRLSAIEGPRNPGEADERDRWRAYQIRLRLSIDEPGGLWRDPGGQGQSMTRWIGWIRAWSRDRLVEPLDRSVAPLASALLLGRREGVDPTVNDAFARTGTAHLLAISGAHLQVLAVALWFLFRVVGLGRKKAYVAVMILTALYAILVGLMPSVVRSASMTVMVCVAGLADRCARPANMLAIAAIATFAWNPSDLFDAGCQLSFIGVSALIWGVPMGFVHEKEPEDPLDRLERLMEPWWKVAIRSASVWIFRSIVVSGIVWLATMPLVAQRFHLVSPIAILLNLPLIPLTTVSLMMAGLTLVFSGVWPPLATPSAWACARCLNATEAIVRWGSAQAWGHRFVAGPSFWVTASFYLFLALSTLTWMARWRSRWFCLAALIASAAWGIVAAILPGSPPKSPEVEALAVGHGLAVVVRSPGGRTLLYDCGRMGDPHVGRRVVAPYFWEKGVGKVDVIILSHADSDHFNGLPDLLDRFPVGLVLIPPEFGGPGNPDADRLVASLRDRRIEVREIVAGDRVDLGPGLDAVAIHPPKGWLPSAKDNDRSVVLDVSSGRRHLLLTGDLDGAGLAELVALTPRPIDVFLSPHHGGRSANPAWLYDWARPTHVLVSQRTPAPGVRDALSAVEARGIPVLRTWDRGALSVKWGLSALRIAGFLDPKPAPVSFLSGLSYRSVLIGIAGFVIGLAVCGALTVIEWGAWTLVRPGRRWAGSRLEPSPWEPIEAMATDGALLSGAFLANPLANGRTLALLHGFAEDRSALLDRALTIHDRGWNVALFDSRSKGLSGGDFCSFGGRETRDFQAWIEVLADRVGPSMTLAAWGRSMGAVVALRVSTEEPRLLALVLEAPFADLSHSVAATIRRLRLPKVFARLILARAGMLAGVSLASPRPIDVAPRVVVSVLLLQGTADPIVPLADARRLMDKFSGDSRLIEVEGAGHANVVEIGGEALIGRVAVFLEAAIPSRILKSDYP